ncbi:MAG TPA: SpoIIE family protein phosphatase [Usitatibacter sp.]|nr:SpoIIE family protein phosphatase [Usitatibacter sp.]
MTADTARLLVVDDNEDNRYTLLRRLGREGYADVLTAATGREALEIMRRERVDLALLDIMMPDMNGYQVLEHLKADTELRNLPVIMISAVEELESVVRCIELGAEDYLAKPFNATLLRARVGASLEKKRLRDAVRASLRRLEQELEAARDLQLSMLPPRFPQWTAERPVHLHAAMEPAREVGGDLYDMFWMDDGRLCFMVGDVSGKGAAAAMFMARMRSLVRMSVSLWQRFAPRTATPSAVARAVNGELFEENTGRMFVTLFLGFLDPYNGRLAYANAGHPPPFMMPRREALRRVVAQPEPPLGVRRDMAYSERTLDLAPGDALFIFSDGVTDAADVGEALFGEARLEQVLEDSRDGSVEDMVGAVRAAVDAFSGEAGRSDDVTMLALRWQPRA